jgi:hypothetical protein
MSLYYRITWGFFWRNTNLAIWGCHGIQLILVYIHLANSDYIIKKDDMHFYYVDFFKIAYIFQIYSIAKKPSIRYDTVNTNLSWLCILTQVILACHVSVS